MNETIQKKWGYEQIRMNVQPKFETTKFEKLRVFAGLCYKKLVVYPGKRSSLHWHKVKDECWFILEGVLLVELEGQEYTLDEGGTLFIEHGSAHRFGSTVGATVIEISTYDDPNDTVRDPDRLSGDMPSGTD